MMVSKMFEDFWKKARFEMKFLAMIVAFSLPLSMLLLADAAVGLVSEHYGLLLTVLRTFELVFAVAWMLFSTSMYREINWLRKTHYRAFSIRMLEGLDEEQKKSETTELVRNIVGFYRGNYSKFTAVLMLGVAVGFSILVTVTYLLLVGSMWFWVAVSRWAINSSMLLIVSVLSVYVHRSWHRKLLRVKEAEKELSEMLGGPIEA
jgi:hypothetical protein